MYLFIALFVSDVKAPVRAYFLQKIFVLSFLTGYFFCLTRWLNSRFFLPSLTKEQKKRPKTAFIRPSSRETSLSHQSKCLQLHARTRRTAFDQLFVLPPILYSSLRYVNSVLRLSPGESTIMRFSMIHTLYLNRFRRRKPTRPFSTNINSC